jgi:hypothetical protein
VCTNGHAECSAHCSTSETTTRLEARCAFADGYRLLRVTGQRQVASVVTGADPPWHVPAEATRCTGLCPFVAIGAWRRRDVSRMDRRHVRTGAARDQAGENREDSCQMLIALVEATVSNSWPPSRGARGT